MKKRQMNDIQNYLIKYNPKATIIDPADILNSNYNISAEWKNILSINSSEERLLQIFEVWEKYCNVELSKTISYLKEHCSHHNLINLGDRFSVLLYYSK